MELVSRLEALAAGLTLYFTGELCQRGHIAPRYANGRACTMCRQANGAKMRETAKETGYYTKPRTRAYNREYARSDKEQDRKLRKTYGITLADRNQMLTEQANCCAICLVAFSEERKIGAAYAVDHCHTTNKVRGLLCHYCNKALGGFKDNPDNLLRAVQYLNKSKDHK